MQTQTEAKMAVKFLVLFVFAIIVIDRTEGACTYPSDLRGTWRSSRWGDVLFTSNQFTVTLTDIGTVVLECDLVDGTVYLSKSTTTRVVLGITVYVVACLDLNQLSYNSYYYYHGNQDIDFVSGDKEPVVLVPPSVSITIGSHCDISAPYHIGTNHMLLRSGSEVSAAVQCPDLFLATFNNYTIDKGSGAQCGGVGYFSVCDNYMNVDVDYSVCSETIFYSSGGSLQCVYSSNNGSTYFINLYNFDNTVDDSTTFRYTCVAIQSGGDIVYASQYPQACTDIQTSTSTASTPYTGGVLEMVANIPSSDSSTSYTAVIVVIILLLLIIILVALTLYHLVYRKRWPAVKKKLPCFGSKSSGQVDPQMASKDDAVEESARDSEQPAEGGPLAGPQPTMVTTAVVSNDPVQKIRTSASSRSIVTPSNMQAELTEEEKASGATTDTTDPPVNPTPRRLPPLDQGPHPVPSGETPRHLDTNISQPHASGIEPVYLARPRVAPLEAVRNSEESDLSSDALTTPPRYPAVYHEPVYQNM